MIEWNQFDKIMVEAEFLNTKNALSTNFIKALKRAKCWKNNEPYCTWDNFTYGLNDKQINDIVDNFKTMKG